MVVPWVAASPLQPGLEDHSVGNSKQLVAPGPSSLGIPPTPLLSTVFSNPIHDLSWALPIGLQNRAKMASPALKTSGCNTLSSVRLRVSSFDTRETRLSKWSLNQEGDTSH